MDSRTESMLARVRGAMQKTDSPEALAAAADAAHDYAQACRDANERLRRCMVFLEKGMRSEALHAAEAEPNLLDLSLSLDLPEAGAWCDLCRRHGWPAAQELASPAIAALNDAYAASLDLEPLLREYRTAVHVRDTAKCVRLLRQVRRKDSGNPAWMEDLRSFEAKRHEELKAQVSDASGHEATSRLEALVAELESADWLTAPDPTWRARARQDLQRLQEKAAFHEGQEIVRALSAAFSAMDYDAATGNLHAYDELLRAGRFQPDEELKTQYEDASSWHREETAKREAEKEYQTCVRDAEQALDSDRPGKELLALERRAAKLDRLLPEALGQRLERALGDYEWRVRRRKRVSAVLMTTGVMVVVVAAGLLAWAKWRATSRANMLAAVQTQYDAAAGTFDTVAFEKLEATLADVREKDPGYYESPAVREWQTKEETLQQEYGRRLELFSGAENELTGLRDSGFAADDARVDGLLEAMKGSTTSAAGRNSAARLTLDWESFKAKRQGDTDRRLSDVLSRLAEAAGALDAVPRTDLALQASGIAGLRTLIGEAEAVRNAADGLRLEITTYRVKADKADVAMKDVAATIAAIEKPTSLKQYFDAIDLFTAAYPGDALAQALKPLQATKHLALAAGALLLPRDLAPDTWYSKELLSQAVVLGADPLYGASLRRLADRETAIAGGAKAMEEMLGDFAQDKDYTDLWITTFVGNDNTIQNGFSHGAPTKARRGLEASFYFPQQGDVLARFAVIRKETKDNKGDPLCSVPNPPQRMPHCKLVTELTGRRLGTDYAAEDADLFWQRQVMETARQQTACWPQIRLVLCRAMCRVLEQGFGDALPVAWKPATREMDLFKPAMHWLCAGHPNWQQCRDKAEEILGRGFPDDSALRSERLQVYVARAALSRGVAWVGVVPLTAAAGSQPFLATADGAKLSELWVVRQEKGSTPTFEVAYERNDQDWAAVADRIGGEALFSPTDGQATGALKATLLKVTGCTDATTVRWPECWPRNRR